MVSLWVTLELPHMDMTYLSILIVLLVLHGVVMSFFVILEHRHPVATLAWILLLIFVPVVGTLLYYYLGRLRFVRRRMRRAQTLEPLLEHLPHGEVSLEEAAIEEWKEEPYSPFVNSFAQLHLPVLEPSQQPNVPLMTLAHRAAGSPLSQGNRTTVLQDAENTYKAIEAAIRGARHHVHVLYYIIRDDSVGQWLRDLLVARARDGVEVRLLFDGLGSYALPDTFWEDLHQAGGRAEAFLPLRFANLTPHSNINFRNHRKLVIVDGRVGFLGGINLGEEYLGKPPHSPWRDTHVELEGSAVSDLQQVFVEDWCYATEELLFESVYFPTPPEPVGEDLVQVIPSGPDHDWFPIHLLLFLSITSANQRIWIATPYFIPDKSILTALITAAMRGVDVRIMLPAKGDHKMVHYAMQSYYKRLLKAGVKIYEYHRGMLHSKTTVVDGRCGTIGSANFDIRSFHLNFELNAFVYSCEVAEQLEAAFKEDLQHAQLVTYDQFRRRPFSRKLYESVARVLSPLL